MNLDSKYCDSKYCFIPCQEILSKSELCSEVYLGLGFQSLKMMDVDTFISQCCVPSLHLTPYDSLLDDSTITFLDLEIHAFVSFYALWLHLYGTVNPMS